MSSFVTRVEREKEEPYTVIFTTDDYCKYSHIENECRKMIGHEKPSNADRIRSMTDEELADFLERWELGDIDYSKTFCDLCKGQYDCHDDCLLDWLKKEVDDGEIHKC